MNISKLGEAKRLHALGLAIHWLRPNSKVPVKSGWTDDKPADTIQQLVKEYVKGNNIGVRLGKPSKIGKYYLAALDIDVKSTDKRHKKLADLWVEENFPGLLASSPITISGRGNGSKHLWLLVKTPLESRALYSSSETVEVFMPSAKPTEKQIEILGEKKVKEGWRLRPAFEIDFMCIGRQVVLPPSIHPDSGKEYKWGRSIEDVSDITVVDVEYILKEMPERKKANKLGGRPKGSTSEKIDIEDVSESELEQKLTPEIIVGIYDGEGVNDRSAYCLTIALSMVRARFTDAQILGVLTNREFFIGDVAFQHAKTSQRQRAARWAYDYCVRKARNEADAAEVFNCEVKIYDTLPPDKAEQQLKRVVTDLGQADWKKKLDRTDNDKLKPTLKNVVLILQHNVGKEVFKRDMFARRDFYGMDTEWGGKKNVSLTDDDTINIKMWFAHKWKIEPTVNTVFEAMVSISGSNSIHPVRDYLESLEWDGVKRIDTWLREYLGAEGQEVYLQAVSRKFLVAAVARIFNPGVKFDWMLILEGLQGIGKSTVGNILAGDKWFLDSLPDLTDKDAALNLQGIWICEMGELANMKRADIDVTKAFVSRRVDKVRPPYGKRYIESERQCVFFGTTNADEYLKDKTGNRRFFPVKVHEVDFDGLARDRDMLWAEALNVYDLTNEKLYMVGEAREIAEQVQSSRVVEDEADIILDKLSVWWKLLQKSRRQKASEIGQALKPFKFQTAELFEDFAFGESGTPPLKEYKQDNYKLQLASSALRKIGLVKVTINGKKWWREEKKTY